MIKASIIVVAIVLILAGLPLTCVGMILDNPALWQPGLVVSFVMGLAVIFFLFAYGGPEEA